MNQSHNNTTPKVVGTVAIAAVLVIAIYTLVLNNKPASSNATVTATTTSTPVASTDTSTSAVEDSTTSTDVSTPTTQTTTTPSTTTTTSSYKDGTYSATASYYVPHGYTNSITAKVTVKNGVITDVNTTNDYQDRESSSYVSSFESAVKTAVVGKKIDGSFSGRIGGASLTGSAFLDTIDSIISQAKA
jgi:uncharacterized protein with FMN-binding domain